MRYLVREIGKLVIRSFPKIERTVLRLAVYELLFNEEVPHRVVLNEAMNFVKHLVMKNQAFCQWCSIKI